MLEKGEEVSELLLAQFTTFLKTIEKEPKEIGSFQKKMISTGKAAGYWAQQLKESTQKTSKTLKE